MTTSPLRVALLGAGPWARMVYAPVLARGPDTELVAVWSRTDAAAAAAAAPYGALATPDLQLAMREAEAVVCAVPPDVQPLLAIRAAHAGKAVALEKPLALDVRGAVEIATVAADVGVPTIVLLTYRFAPAVREFVAQAQSFGALGGRGAFISGAYLGETWGRGWRLEEGALLDVGPHIVDLADAALGPVIAVTARGDEQGWVGLLLEHASGAVSDVDVCCRAAIEPSRTELEVFGPGGRLAVDARIDERTDVFRIWREELVAAARGVRPATVDAARGVHVQRVVEAARRSLRTATRVELSRV